MRRKFPPLHPGPSQLLHGADYNPEQWKLYPDVLAEDIRLMKLAHCNVMSVGIFAWSALEPQEGVFTFEWLDERLDTLAQNGISVLLATPSGARPAWLSQKYPEVLRVGANRVRNLHGHRHNHCLTSPVYREKVASINARLAERYAQHPAVIGWHVSNEYGGDCHCDLCQIAFREWLQRKYATLDALNQAWWTTFWSHTYTEWSQIESPAPHGETMVHGLNLDWRRFVTDQTLSFLQHEVQSARTANAALPVTTNFMEAYDGLNYWRLKDAVDVISWDSYPTWHHEADDCQLAAWVAMMHDIHRSLKAGQPFLLMESTPSVTNWQPVSKLKRPGMHRLASLQAVAHGADSVQYFQWRKSRGSSEKFHGAVVDHAGHEHTRVFREVSQLGEELQALQPVAGTSIQPQVALIFDAENRWAVNDAQGPRNTAINYEKTVQQFYRALWDHAVPVDVIEMETDLTPYKLVIAPMLYMVKPGVAERMERFVENGGVLVATYWSGVVNEVDLCFLGGNPGPLRKVFGVWSEELDALHDGDENGMVLADGNFLGLTGTYEVKELCDLIHLEGAEALAHYATDFYAGRPALTVNRFGRGFAYYVAARNPDSFTHDFIGKLIESHRLNRVLETQLPSGVTAQLRTDGEHDYVFVMNFSAATQTVPLAPDEASTNRSAKTNENAIAIAYTDLVSGASVSNPLVLDGYGVRVLQRPSNGAFMPAAGARQM